MQNLSSKISFNIEVAKSDLNNLQTILEHFSKLVRQIEIPLPSFVSKANYISIYILEKLGIIDPSQEQIDIVEDLVSLVNTRASTQTNFQPLLN